jgi:hypothetical protein
MISPVLFFIPSQISNGKFVTGVGLTAFVNAARTCLNVVILEKDQSKIQETRFIRGFAHRGFAYSRKIIVVIFTRRMSLALTRSLLRRRTE